MRVAGAGWPDFSKEQLDCVPFDGDKPGIIYVWPKPDISDYVGARTCLSLDSVAVDEGTQSTHPAPRQTGGKY